jgi:hypothetical protein
MLVPWRLLSSTMDDALNNLTVGMLAKRRQIHVTDLLQKTGENIGIRFTSRPSLFQRYVLACSTTTTTTYIHSLTHSHTHLSTYQLQKSGERLKKHLTLEMMDLPRDGGRQFVSVLHHDQLIKKKEKPNSKRRRRNSNHHEL